ncbi:MAG TPA: DinB family protein, partial [Aggregatilineales bacterium]|nr:DinB family protein [Aggregatilineales bacterium]
RQELDWAHELLEMVMADVTPEQMQWLPPGVANPLGAIYAHAILAEDGVVNGMLRQAAPLFASTWSGKSGVAVPQHNMTAEWAHNLKPDLATLRAYGKAVYAATEDYLATLNEAMLDQEIDLSSVGLGKRTLGWCLAALVVSHLHNMVGEASTLKGVQGARGYPF